MRATSNKPNDSSTAKIIRAVNFSFDVGHGWRGNIVVEMAVECSVFSVKPIKNGERLRRFHNPNSS